MTGGDERRGGPRRAGHRHVELPGALLDRAKPLMDVAAICVAAIEAACDAVETGEVRVLTFGFRTTRTLCVQIQPPGPEATTAEAERVARQTAAVEPKSLASGPAVS